MLEHGSYSGDPVTKVLLQPLTGWSSGPGQRGCGGLLRMDRQAAEVLQRDPGLQPWTLLAAWWHSKKQSLERAERC